ncbi:hypothetical protein JD844_026034 [Phrynosoma platyrhinos]|uniref:Uncharacterized protein n=1 Tax=Phrynosoma platyrhinos TaxID=52577 RepID=A0ABQ7SED8_PHRPL|nr:hypothetical protein JD844_026034 [Phrynosoma platyrhinos]
MVRKFALGGDLTSHALHRFRKVLSKLNFSIPEDIVRKIAQCTPGVVELVLIPGTKGQQNYTVPLQNDSNLRLQLAEREQALLALQETVQILQMKVRRLEHLLHLKNVRIDDLTRRMQQGEQKRK